MSVTQWHRAKVFEDSGLTVMARVLGNAGVAIKRADFGDITYAVHESDGTEVTPVTSLAVTDVVFDEMQADDPRWPHADAGFNFLYTIPAASFPRGDKVSFVEFRFSPSEGEPFHVGWRVEVLGLFRS